MQITNFTEQDREQVESIFSMYWNDPIFLKELSDAITDNPEKFYVAKDRDEVVGVLGYKNPPDYFNEFVKTDNPVELYVIASKYKRKGIGMNLKEKMIDVAREKGFSEIVLFSPGTHDSSWEFHDTLNFQRMGEVTPPDDDVGHVWSRVL